MRTPPQLEDVKASNENHAVLMVLVTSCPGDPVKDEEEIFYSYSSPASSFNSWKIHCYHSKRANNCDRW
ncbi:hypothetical protein scyTo_0010803 [Scyliorhinus torazame]|uniref:Uncharacterized protein n=1 Tax=Scyliorhinus torazame TaxID=75743 RepID=A0A401PBR1_SCYTO|nr:hypothetical protein [Scyliorhinus torazame]